MGNFYDDNADLRWYVERGIDWEPIVRLTEYGYKAEDGFADVDEAVDFYKDVLSLVGEYAADAIAPRWRELDQAHPHLVDGEVEEAPVVREIMEGLGEMELYSACLPRELGGMNCPLLVFQLQQEMIARADVSTCTHVGFHGGIALAALMYSVIEGTTAFQLDPPQITETRFRECIEEIGSGAAWGSMDITEPHAGSDMAALRCVGRQDADGNWTVSGQKIFITSGHGRWHFVIAKTEEDAGDDAGLGGLKGLSMFLVPAWEDDADGNRRRLATVVGVEEKMGHNASATCTLAFEDTPAQLVGERGQGFKYMLILMNNARIGVGFEAIGVMEAALQAARAYAAQRPSMGKMIERHEMVAEMLEEMQTDLQVCRAVGVSAAWHEEISQKSQIALKHLPMSDAERAEVERAQRRHARQSRFLTPLLKWFGGEKAVDNARRAIQVHGGSGYIQEYGVDKLLRDAMIFPIYEGTTQIQALMVMKDNLMGVVKDPKRFVREQARVRLRSVSARDPMERRVAALRLQALQAIQFLLSRLAAAKLKELRHVGPSEWSGAFKEWDPKRDFALAMLHADRLTGLLFDAAAAEILWEQQLKDAGRRELLERWLEQAEPRAHYRFTRITTTGARLLAKLAEAEGIAPEVAEERARAAK